MSIVTSSLIMKSLTAILTIICLDTVLGILIGFKDGTFTLSKLPEFLSKNVLPYMGGLSVIAIMAVYVNQVDPSTGAIIEGIYYTASATVALKFTKEALLDKTRQLFSTPE